MSLINRGLAAFLFTAVIYFGLSVGKVHSNDFVSGAEKFISALAAKAEKSLLSEEIKPIEHQKRFRKLMLDSFDLNGVGKWVIGRYWRRSSKHERAEYLNLFEEFIVATYSKRFRGYTKAKLKINIPIIGQNQSPCEATTKTVPINATVQVNEVNVNVKAINNIPAYPSELSL